MTEHTKCSQCGAELEPGWATCWNCGAEVELHSAEVVEESSQLVGKSQATIQWVKVDKQKMMDAGKQIKLVVWLTLIIIFIPVATHIVVWITDNQRFYVLGIILSLLLIVAQLVNLYHAGDDLIKSVSKSESESDN